MQRLSTSNNACVDCMYMYMFTPNQGNCQAIHLTHVLITFHPQYMYNIRWQPTHSTLDSVSPIMSDLPLSWEETIFCAVGDPVTYVHVQVQVYTRLLKLYHTGGSLHINNTGASHVYTKLGLLLQIVNGRFTCISAYQTQLYH